MAGRPPDSTDAGPRTARAVLVTVGSLGAATAAAAVFEGAVGIADASVAYLPAVVLVAGLYGMWPAIATSLVALLTYDFLFTQPRFTFEVTDPAELLSLLLFLMVAVVIGRLAALLRERAETADRRARESVSLVAMSRSIAMATSFREAAAEVAERLRDDAEMAGVWIRMGADDESPAAVVAAAAAAPEPPAMPSPWTLLRDPSDGSSDWVRITNGMGNAATTDGGTPEEVALEAYRVPIEADGVLGAILAVRRPEDPRPGRGARRLLSMAADQLGIAARRDELRAELTAAEVARQSDALRTAILDSVSHDLRTPIATIRALAGGLLDDADRAGLTELRASAAGIDSEAERLAELVRNLLDMSRIQGGALRPDLAPYDPAELVETAVRRVGNAHGRSVEVHVPEDLPPVYVDAVLLDVALGNVLDNAMRYAPAPAVVRLTATASPDAGRLALVVEDGGSGVPPDALPHLFDRFYRAPAGPEAARHGLGMGLAIARGFLEAMGGTIDAEPSTLGGLAVRIGLPLAPPAADIGERR